MTRYFRTAYAVSLTSLLLTLISAVATGVHMPFSAFTCLLFGLLLVLLPNVLQKWEGKRTLFALLGAAAALLGFLPVLLLTGPLLQVLAYAASVAAAAIFFAALRHNTTYNNFKARFVFITIIVLLVFSYFILSTTWLLPSKDSLYGKPLLDPERVKLALNDIIPYAIVHLATGILCLRGLRAQHGAVDERRFQQRQLRDALIFITAVSTVFIAAPFLKTIWEYLLNNAIAPFLKMLARFVEDVVAGAMKGGDMPMSGNPVPTEAPTTAVPEITQPIGTPAPVSGPVFSNETPPPAALKSDAALRAGFALLVLAIVVTIACVALVKALRRLKKDDRSYPNESRESLPETDHPKKETKPAKFSADPRKRMRYLYAEFLKHLRKRVIQRDPVTQPGATSGNDSHIWGETSNSGYSWTKAGMTALPAQSSSMSSITLRDEGLGREAAATVMKWFDRSPRKRKAGARAPRVFQTNTCGEIESRAKTLTCADEADLAAFTLYYEQARYQTNEDPSPKDAARMAELFGKIKPQI